MAESKKTKTEKHEVVVRHALFRYDVAKKTASGKDDVLIKHAERNARIWVNDDDYDRGVEHGAFFMGQPEVSISDAMGGLRTLEQHIADSTGGTATTEADPSKNDDEFDFAKEDDESVTDFLKRHDPDVIIVKSQGTDDALLKRILSLEYLSTDGDPRPELKNVLVDLIGNNPEEDEHGNWVNEPKIEDPADGEDPKNEDEQKKAVRVRRSGAGRAKTARSTKGDKGA